MPACADNQPADELAGESSDDGESGKGDEASTFTFFQVSPDLRACAPSTTCGGWYVSRVNRAQTNCTRGVTAAKCFVSSFDWSGTAMPVSVAKSYETRLFSGEQMLLRGDLVPSADDGGLSLRVTEIWVPGSDSGTAEGVFVMVHDNGRRCITAPCANLDEARLNSSRTATITTLDLEASGADANVIERAFEELYDEGVIVVGDRFYPDGGKGRTANQFYTRAPVPLF